MRLDMNSWKVEDVMFGKKTAYHEGVLHVNRQDFKEYLLSTPGDVQDIEVCLAKPRERLRITHILDVVEPRITSDGEDIFPGFLAPPVAMHPCSLNRLEGVSVMTIPKLQGTTPPLTPHQGIVDMSGPGAEYTPFSKLHNIVLEVALEPGLPAAEADRAMRFVVLKAASYVARTTLGQPGAQSRPYDLTRSPSDLPKIVAIIQLGGQRVLHDNYVYGHSVTGILPTYIHPNEFYYGAVVCGNYTYASQRNFTYIYENSALIECLYDGHGKTHAFLGIIITQGYNQSHAAKTLSANFAANIAKTLGADSAILTADGAGNAHIDVMFTCEQCEKLGIKTVLQINEMAGPDGTDPGLVDFVSEADAMVSVGNREELLIIDEMPTVGQPLQATDGRMKIPVRDICGATNQMGQWNLGIAEY